MSEVCPHHDRELTHCPLCLVDRRTQVERECEGEIARLKAALGDIAAGDCCGTPGCSPDDPCCEVMEARKALGGDL